MRQSAPQLLPYGAYVSLLAPFLIAFIANDTDYKAFYWN